MACTTSIWPVGWWIFPPPQRWGPIWTVYGSLPNTAPLTGLTSGSGTLLQVKVFCISSIFHCPSLKRKFCHFHQRFDWKLLKWQRPVQAITKILAKNYFRFSCLLLNHTFLMYETFHIYSFISRLYVVRKRISQWLYQPLLWYTLLKLTTLVDKWCINKHTNF